MPITFKDRAITPGSYPFKSQHKAPWCSETVDQVHGALKQLEARVNESERSCTQRLHALFDDLAGNVSQVAAQRAETEALVSELRAAVQKAEGEVKRSVDALESQFQVQLAPLSICTLDNFSGCASPCFVASASPKLRE
jgi:septal ring factor EnvC (AmiA/AmiB activator)